MKPISIIGGTLAAVTLAVATGRRNQIPYPLPPQLDLPDIEWAGWTATAAQPTKNTRWDKSFRVYWLTKPGEKRLSIKLIRHDMRNFVLSLRAGNTRVGHIQAQPVWRQGTELWMVVNSNVDYSHRPGYRGKGLGSMLYLAMQAVLNAYEFRQVKMVSEAEGINMPGGTSTAARKVWTRLREAGRINRTGRAALKIAGTDITNSPGTNRHTTRWDRGTIPARDLLGLKGTYAEHRQFAQSPTGRYTQERWAEFVQDIRENGVRCGLDIRVWWTDDMPSDLARAQNPTAREAKRVLERDGVHLLPKLPGETLAPVEAFIYEGNHRVRAAAEAGIEVPVQVTYYGHSEDKARRHAAGVSDSAERNILTLQKAVKGAKGR